MGTILIILGIYLLYKFIVDFAIPIYKTSKRVQEQFRNMNQQMKENGSMNQRPFGTSTQNQPGNQSASKDYIEFEEVKD